MGFRISWAAPAISRCFSPLSVRNVISSTIDEVSRRVKRLHIERD